MLAQAWLDASQAYKTKTTRDLRVKIAAAKHKYDQAKKQAIDACNDRSRIRYRAETTRAKEAYFDLMSERQELSARRRHCKELLERWDDAAEVHTKVAPRTRANPVDAAAGHRETDGTWQPMLGTDGTQLTKYP